MALAAAARVSCLAAAAMIAAAAAAASTSAVAAGGPSPQLLITPGMVIPRGRIPLECFPSASGSATMMARNSTPHLIPMGRTVSWRIVNGAFGGETQTFNLRQPVAPGATFRLTTSGNGPACQAWLEPP